MENEIFFLPGKSARKKEAKGKRKSNSHSRFVLNVT
jgi:hypothetical protein